MATALVVGGENRFVSTRVTPRLAEHGIEVVAVWTVDKEPKAVLPKVDLVYFLSDIMSHRHNDRVKTMAVKAGVPIVYGLQKWSVTQQRLVDAGFPALSNVIALPDSTETIIVEEMSMPQAETAEPINIFTLDNIATGYHRGQLVRTRNSPVDMTSFWLVELSEGPAKGHFLELLFTTASRDLQRLSEVLRHGKVPLEALRDPWVASDIGGLPLQFHIGPGGVFTSYPEGQWKLKSTHQRKAAEAARLEAEKEDTLAITEATYQQFADYRTAGKSARIYATRAVPLFADNPFATTEEILPLMSVKTPGQANNGIALARKLLGLKGIKYFFTQEQYDLFAARCRTFGRTPAVMEVANAKSRWHDVAKPVAASTPASTSTDLDDDDDDDLFAALNALPDYDETQHSEASMRASSPPTRPVTIETVPAASVPPGTPVAPGVTPPAKAAPPAPVAALIPAVVPTETPEALGEFKTVLAMLREEMRKAGIESVSVGPKGVQFRQVVIVDHTLDV